MAHGRTSGSGEGVPTGGRLTGRLAQAVPFRGDREMHIFLKYAKLWEAHLDYAAPAKP